MSEEPQFYVQSRISGEATGPFTVHDVCFAIASADIRANTMVVFVGDQSWFRAGLLPFFATLTPRYHDWLWCIKNNPRSAGAKANALALAATPLLIIAVVFGMAVFPPGRYPRILLVAPGLLGAGAFLYPFGYLVFKTPKPIGIGLSALVALLGACALFWLLLAFSKSF